MESNFEGPEIHERNITTEKAQRVDEKNGVICLVINVYSRSYGY